MSLRKVQSIGEDPTFCLADHHVHVILGHILDYWADYWGMPRISLPEPGREKIETPSVLRFRQWKKRFFQLHCAREIPLDSYLLTPSIPEYIDDLDGALFQACVQSTLSDFVDGVLGPSVDQYRAALSGYMYFMGIPWFLPKGWSPFNLRASRHRLSATTDIWSVFPEILENLVYLRDPTDLITPEGADVIDMAAYRTWGFAHYCDIFGIDLNFMRQQVHLIIPQRPKTRRR